MQKQFFIFIAVVILTFGIIGCDSAGNSNQTNKETKPTQEKSNSKPEANNSGKPAQNVDSNKEVPSPKCELTKAPEIKGFYLGQTVAEIDGKIPGFKAAYEKEKDKQTDDRKKADFVLMTSGSSFAENSVLDSKEYSDYQFIWHFLDDKLMALVVRNTDDETGKIEKVKDLLNKYIKDYNLPQTGWKVESEESATLSCAGFRADVSAHFQSGPSLMITDLGLEKENKKRGL